MVIDQAAIRRLEQEFRTSCISGGELLERELKQTLLDAKLTGRVYTEIYRMVNGRPVPVGKRSKPHQASAPGQTPAIDTGALYDSIQSKPVSAGYGNQTRARVTISAVHAYYLEFGTRNMAPRPWIRKTLQYIASSGIMLRHVGNEARKRIR